LDEVVKKSLRWSNLGIASGPRVPLYLFFKKDAAAPANAALTVNKLRGTRPRLEPRSPFTARATSACRIRSPSLPARCAAWSTRPPVLRQALVFPM